jgi:hypothetical protein
MQVLYAMWGQVRCGRKSYGIPIAMARTAEAVRSHRENTLEMSG